MEKTFWAKFSEEPFVDKFVGREELLAEVDKAIADIAYNHLITFLGEGGIGKTALLRRIYNKHKDNSDLLVIQIDYISSKSNSLQGIGGAVIGQLLEKGAITQQELINFQEQMQNAMQIFLERENQDLSEQLEFDAYLSLIHQVNQKLKNKRVLLLSDSLESSPDDQEQGNPINTLASKFQKIVIVWAGRVDDRSETELRIAKDIFSSEGWIVHEPIFLKKFTIDETRAYFAKVLPVLRQPELIDTIHILSAGKPILLAFMVEWFKHRVRLPDYINKSKEELEALDPFHLRMLRQDFELVLIRRVQAVRSPLEKALLFLSFLDRRYDKRILQLALNRPIEYIESLEAELRGMAFVRSFLDDSSGLLHDEAKRLIHQYAWPPYDPTHEDRDLLARKVIDGFYVPEIKRLRDEAAAILKKANGVPVQVPQEILAHELEMECLDYHYRISLDQGRRYVTKLIGEGILLRKREGVRHEIRTRVGENEAEVAVARINLKRGQVEGNREIVEQALNQKNSSEGSALASPWYRTTLLYELSDAHPEPQKKAAYLMQAIEIAEQSPDQEASAKIYNDLGLMYRRHGLFAEAEETYQKRLAFVDDPEQKAATPNNLALVKLLQGEIDQAKSLAGMALER